MKAILLRYPFLVTDYGQESGSRKGGRVKVALIPLRGEGREKG